MKTADGAPYLGSLALLLQLLQLLGSQETDGLVPSNQFCSSWHRGKDDVSPQAANAAGGRKKKKPRRSQEGIGSSR